MPKLEIYKGGQFLREYVFPDADVLGVGRTPANDIVLPDESRKVSRFHAAIVRTPGKGGQFFIRDFGSLHSTKVCGAPVCQRVLNDGDAIQIAGYRLIYSTAAQGASRFQHLQVVSKKTDELFPESTTIGFDARSGRAAAHLPADRQELLEQLHRKVISRTGLHEFAEELVTAVLRVLRADRGFLGLFREDDPGHYRETGVVNLGAETIDISDGTFAEHLLQGQAITEGAVLLVPISAGQKVSGFFCVSRSERRGPFSPEDADFLLTAGLIPDWNEQGFEKSEAAEPMDWSVEMVGQSRRMAELAGEIRRAAATEMNVLILGETGTGKELVARAIHGHCRHSKGPFIDRNCSQTTETLAESEIFGYVPKSGIAGADPRGAKGWFEEANGGTLFMDEIHRLTPAMQDKFLRVLQEKTVSRIGASAPVAVDVKVLGATDEDLERAMHEGSLRRPFYYRFGIQIHLPPLRERKEDIPLLAYYFLDKYAKKSGARTRVISHRALRELVNYDWPGNVRQLEHVIQAGVSTNQEVLFSWDFHLVRDALPQEISPATETVKINPDDSHPEVARRVPQSMDEIEKEKIKEALEVTQGNATKSAQLLGYKSRQTILNKMDRYGIPRNYADPQAYDK